MRRKTLEEQYKELREEGHCTLEARDLEAFDLDVYVMEEDEYNALMNAWKAQGSPEFPLPLFPREEE